MAANTGNEFKIFDCKLTHAEFQRLSSFIYDELGIKLPDMKKVMLESRLQRRLRDLGMTSFKDYIDYVFSKHGRDNEMVHMFDVVTTNKTDFFRENMHFEYMNQFILKEVAQKNSNFVNIWSAGCSSGEEPYTLTIVLSEAIENGLISDFKILATDISTRILKMAVDAIYPLNRIEDIPLHLKKKYFLKSKDTLNKTARVIPELRRKITFERLNFMDDVYPINQIFDIVFCRNVIIYFDHQTQERVITKLCSKLKTGGYLFLGHSESIAGMNLPLVNVKPTVFRKI
jgi:chemotaxis protein methyltransferase CheR